MTLAIELSPTFCLRISHELFLAALKAIRRFLS
jgi:hypothetical protein